MRGFQKTSHEKLTNCSPYCLTIHQYFGTKTHIKERLISKILIFKKKIFQAVQKLFTNLLKKTKMFTKPLTRALWFIQTLFSGNRLELSPWSFTHVLKKIETTLRWNCLSKALRFLQITAKHQDCPFFAVFLTVKTSSQNISIKQLQMSLKRHEHQGRYWGKKLP